MYFWTNVTLSLKSSAGKASTQDFTGRLEFGTQGGGGEVDSLKSADPNKKELRAI